MIFDCTHAKNLMDKPFGKGVVIEYLGKRPVGKKNRVMVYWKLKCECGNEYEAHSKTLLGGNSTSCGCWKSEKRVDYSGQEYNRIKILKFLEKQNNKDKCNYYIYECQCHCGKIFNKIGSYIVSGAILSCGCLKDAIGFEFGDIPHGYWQRIENSALRRKIEFKITPNYAWEIWQKQNGKCRFTNESLIFHRTGTDAYTKQTTASLDRIDSSKGYIEGNVQWVHKTINFMKLSMSDQEFIQWCAKVCQAQC